MRKKMLPLLLLACLTACQEKMADRAERDARETTEKRCPMRLNAEGTVILERINFDKSTLVWCQDYLFDVDSTYNVTDAEVRELLLQELKNTPSYLPYMKNGFNFRYVYCRMSNPKDTVIDLTLTPKDYR